MKAQIQIVKLTKIMAHSINFQDIEDKLLLLQHIKLGSQHYCEASGIGRKLSKYAADEWYEYSSRLKRIVSSYVLECAIRIRVCQDTLISLGSKTDFKLKDKEARENIIIGLVHLGSFDLSLRESCNKVLHSTYIDLSWQEKRLNLMP